jgi:alpha-tubulin suppressor-like RCC1 family protein
MTYAYKFDKVSVYYLHDSETRNIRGARVFFANSVTSKVLLLHTLKDVADVTFAPSKAIGSGESLVVENPLMTDNSTAIVAGTVWEDYSASGFVASASSTLSETFFAFMAFDGIISSSSFWHSANNEYMATNPEWLRLDYPVAVVLKKYFLTSRNSFSAGGSELDFPNTFDIQGTNAESPEYDDWVTLDTQTGQASRIETNFQIVEYDLSSNTQAYTKYRILIRGVGENDGGRGNGTFVAVLPEFRLFTSRAAPLALTGSDWATGDHVFVYAKAVESDDSTNDVGIDGYSPSADSANLLTALTADARLLRYQIREKNVGNTRYAESADPGIGVDPAADTSAVLVGFRYRKSTPYDAQRANYVQAYKDGTTGTEAVFTTAAYSNWGSVTPQKGPNDVVMAAVATDYRDEDLVFPDGKVSKFLGVFSIFHHRSDGVFRFLVSRPDHHNGAGTDSQAWFDLLAGNDKFMRVPQFGENDIYTVRNRGIYDSSFFQADVATLDGVKAFTNNVNTLFVVYMYGPAVEYPSGRLVTRVEVIPDFATAVQGGGESTVALSADGVVYAWGRNLNGQLGQGDNDTRLTPVPVTGGSLAGKKVTAISAGFHQVLALDSDGVLHGWGRNDAGHLGQGYADPIRVLTPVSITGGSLTGKTVTAVAGGRNQSFALDSDGVLHAWGRNDDGELGQGVTGNLLTPVFVTGGSLTGKTVTALASSMESAVFMVAITSDGVVHAWGRNANGQIGQGNFNVANYTTPMAVMGLTGKIVTAVACGESHALVLDSDGGVHAWGANNTGQLGIGSTSDSNVPVQISGIKGAAISAGRLNSYILGTDGVLYAFGRGAEGQLGQGPPSGAKFTPVPTVGGSLTGKNVTAVMGGNLFTLALDSNGGVHAWGANNTGQLGLGDTDQRNTPVAVDLPLEPPVPMTYAHSAPAGVSVYYLHDSETRNIRGARIDFADSVTSKVLLLHTLKGLPALTVDAYKAVGEGLLAENPPMTGNSTSTVAGTVWEDYSASGFVASASSIFSSSFQAFRAFDKQPFRAPGQQTVWASVNNVNMVRDPEWLRLDYPASVSVVLKKYSLTSREEDANYANDFPNTFDIQGTNAESPEDDDWVTLDTQTGQASRIEARFQTVEYDLSQNTQAYDKYRILVRGVGVDDGGGRGDGTFYVAFAEFRLFTTRPAPLALTGSDWATGGHLFVYATAAESEDATYDVGIDGYSAAADGANLLTALTTGTNEAIVAFHYGNHDNAYGDGSRAAAARTGKIFADAVLENPKFTSNTTVATDFGSVYGWDTSTGWEVSASSILSSTWVAWQAFTKGLGGFDNAWVSARVFDRTTGVGLAWLQIQFPNPTILKSYQLNASNTTADWATRSPRDWEIQGSRDGTTWETIPGAGRTSFTDWVAQGTVFTFDVSENSTSYIYYRLYITGNNANGRGNDNTTVIDEWTLNVIPTDSTKYGSLTVTNPGADQTEYTWTPPAWATEADVLVVAGGGGGGSTSGVSSAIGGAGGGAGGVIVMREVALNPGSVSMGVGKGGQGAGYNNNTSGTNGNDSFFSSYVAIGGGGGASRDVGSQTGFSGGSGGGAVGTRSIFKAGGSGTPGQGNDGGSGRIACPGGGAGSAFIVTFSGENDANQVANGGSGLSVPEFHEYGQSGYFGGGGAPGDGAINNYYSSIRGGIGGGGGGGVDGSPNGQNGLNNTGGGGGGAASAMLTTNGVGGNGGSGIVLVRLRGDDSGANPMRLRYRIREERVGNTTYEESVDPGTAIQGVDAAAVLVAFRYFQTRLSVGDIIARAFSGAPPKPYSIERTLVNYGLVSARQEGGGGGGGRRRDLRSAFGRFRRRGNPNSES